MATKTATFTANNGDISLDLGFTANKIFILKWAEYCFNLGYGDHGTKEEPITFEDSSNQNKADAIAERVFILGKAEAKSQIMKDQKEATREANAEVIATIDNA